MVIVKGLKCLEMWVSKRMNHKIINNIKKIWGGKNNLVCISWYEDPDWSERHKRVVRKYQRMCLINKIDRFICGVRSPNLLSYPFK